MRRPAGNPYPEAATGPAPVSASAAFGLPLLIVGASARAAAASARRAGFVATAVDLFADRDLLAIAPTVRVDRDAYPRALLDVASRLPSCPWIYTGALENHPNLVDRLALARPLLGVSGEALRRSRDPSFWSAALARNGLPAVPCLDERDEPPSSGAWLLKPLASAAGRGIRTWRLGEGPIPPGSFVQALARGVPLSGCFVGDGERARLVGVTRQLLGRSEAGLRVLYRGSAGPWPIGRAARRAISGLGDVLAGACGLRGLFGVDLAWDGDRAWAIEINPRYTASVEVLEEGLGRALLADHAAAFGVQADRRSAAGRRRHRRSVAKLILTAEAPGVAPLAWPWTDPGDPRALVADLPAPGAPLATGDPVLTVFGRGPNLAIAFASLRARAARWRWRIGGWPAPGRTHTR